MSQSLTGAAALMINPATKFAALVQGLFIFHKPDFTKACAVVSQGWNGTRETQTSQGVRMLPRMPQQGCRASQQDTGNQWVKQIQVPSHHHHRFLPSRRTLCLSFPIQKSTSCRCRQPVLLSSHPDPGAVPGSPSRGGAEQGMEQLAPSHSPAP